MRDHWLSIEDTKNGLSVCSSWKKLKKNLDNELCCYAERRRLGAAVTEQQQAGTNEAVTSQRIANVPVFF